MTQKQLGQFYTNKNIFNHPAFIQWVNKIPLEDRECILEPFAGRNGIIKMLSDLKLVNQFTSYDIVPGHDAVIYRDTVLDFPQKFALTVTNPPFLARNSATRRQLPIKIDPYNDLYELCLNLCLLNCQYVAAIVPESFIVSPFFKNRLEVVISLAERHIFKDTEHPVCLALFGPEETTSHKIYRNRNYLGNSQELERDVNNFFENIEHNYEIKYYDPTGHIGLIAIDATDATKGIRFTPGIEVKSEDVSGTSRLRTRFTVFNSNGKALSATKVEKLIKVLNRNLKKYRHLSHDTQLTAFKGVRDDGWYRRRLDFTTARKLVALSLASL